MKYGRLIENSYPYKKGTEFIITGGDDGWGSGYPFYSGTIRGIRFSFERGRVEIISEEEFINRVIKCEPIILPEENY
jgi:hypothetical protein